MARHLKAAYFLMCTISLAVTLLVLKSDHSHYMNAVVGPTTSHNKDAATSDNKDSTSHVKEAVRTQNTIEISRRSANRVLLSEDIPVKQDKTTLSLLNPKPCRCKGISYFLWDLTEEEQEQMRTRRQKQMDKFTERVSKADHPLLFVDGSSPLSYPSVGVEVIPEGSVEVPGLAVTDTTERTQYKVQLIADMGILMITASVSEVDLTGVGTSTFTAKSPSLAYLNRQLEFIVYTNTVFDFGVVDIVRFKYEKYEAKIPINIRFKPVPILYDPGPENSITKKVTMMTKTFLRYDVVRRLIKSVRKFYPDIRIIVADDSRPIQDLQDNKTDHYVMPFGTGYFAGRNLAMSQVTTQYLMYADDDNVFTKKTKVEKLVEVLDNTDMDVVAGISDLVDGKKPDYEADKINFLSTGLGADCMMRKKGYYRTVPGFPDCVMTGRTINFYVGRTERVRAVGFNPMHTRLGHTEFFIDALGRLKFAVCKGVVIEHRRYRPKDYMVYRKPEGDYDFNIRMHKYFRNNLNCYRRIWTD